MASDHPQNLDEIPRIREASAGTILAQHSDQIGSPAMTDAEMPLPPLEWNQTQRPYPQVCLHELFEAQARQTPESVAVSDEKQQLTYSVLNLRANQLARHLRKLGVGPDRLVGVAVDRSAGLLVALLGVMKAGGAYVPLDPEYPQERLAFMVGDSGLKVVLTQASLLAKLPKVISQPVCLDSHWGLISQESGHDFSSGAEPNHLVYVIYTSGSTGLPKGVQISHRSLVNVMESLRTRPGMTAQDTFFATTTLSFDIATVELYLPLIVGGRVFVANRGIASDVQRFQEGLAMSGASVLQGAPSFWRILIESGWRGDDKLKFFCGGEALRGALAKEMLKRSSSVWNMYAPSETTVYSTVFQVMPGDSPILIGTPIANTQTYILNDALAPLPVGIAGELHMGGDGLARGYLNRPELTAEKFITNPFSDQPGARLYKTGDLARYRPDGNIEFLGRIDNQVKIRGFRIETGEIESVLVEHLAVRAAVVVAREDTPGDARLVAYVIPRSGHSFPTEELRVFLKTKLPEYMIPARFEFLDELPLTPNGKVDRRALPAPGTSSQSRASAGLAPRTELEENLERIFAEVLGLERVSVNEDFFDAGGDSLLALKLITRVEQALGQRFSLAALIEAPSVREVAAILSGQQSPQAVPGVLPLQPSGTRPPFFFVGAGPHHRPLALRLAPDQPFLGLVLDETDVKTLPLPFKLADLAQILIKRMREVQPKGPYFLGGPCLNALFAYEMAHQLRTSGDEVGLVILFDPNHPVQVLKHSRGKSLSERVSLITQRARFEFINLKEQGMPYALQGWKRVKARMSVRAKWSAYQLRLLRGDPVEGELRDLGRVVSFAMLSYRPQPYVGHVALVQSEPPAQDLCPGDNTVGWGDIVKGKLDLHFIPGIPRHEDMFREPFAEIAARRLTAILSEAQEASALNDLPKAVRPLKIK